MSKQITYLAAPYTHANQAVRHHRFEDINFTAARLMERGNIVFSPISMLHPISLRMAPQPREWWIDYDENFMRLCGECFVLTLEGWEESEGVRREIAHFKGRLVPIYLLDPDTFELAKVAGT